MKVKKILKHIDCVTPVKIVEFNSKTSEEYEYFSGIVADIPWCYAELPLDTDSDGEAICICKDLDTEKSYLNIYVRG